MKKLALYYFDECPYCQIVIKALRETKLNEHVTMNNIRHVASHREKLVKDTGRSTVPCLYIDEKPMFESRDIAQWIHDYAKTLK